MTTRIFYSWQSDIKAAACRTLIGDALDAAARSLVADQVVAALPIVDRDTAGVPGAPDIGATILAKIDMADVFVADLTIIGRIDERAMPNPNVLLELGYALKALGDRRIVLLQNLAFGATDSLPFDLRQKRVHGFVSAEHDADRATPRKALTSFLRDALASTLRSIERDEATQLSGPALWKQRLRRAHLERTWVEIDSAIEVDTGRRDASGRPRTVAAILDGFVAVNDVQDDHFTLSIPTRGTHGSRIVTAPYEHVEALWPGGEGRVHVSFKRTLLLKNGTSAFT